MLFYKKHKDLLNPVSSRELRVLVKKGELYHKNYIKKLINKYLILIVHLINQGE